MLDIIRQNLRLPIKDLVKLINEETGEEYTYDAIQKKRKKILDEDTTFGLIPLTTKEDNLDKIVESVKKHSFKYNKIIPNKGNKNLLIIDPADIHIGKLSTQYETGESYTTEEAVSIVEKGINKILERACNFDIAETWLIVGNDVLHVDNRDGTTTAGTKQDIDGTWHENFERATKMYVKIIEQLMCIGRVRVIFNPSNHDYHSGFMLAKVLEAWFTKSDIVFDTTIQHRKYSQFGKNLIMTTHGDEGKDTDIPYLMPNEEPKMWANTKYRYAYLHHIHHKKVFRYKSGSDYNGITIEYLRSPSATDAWHYRNGYCTAPRAVEAFIHSPDEGQIARITTYVK